MRKPCEQCGKEFSAHSRYPSRYCSPNCRKEGKHARYQRTCERCQQPFYVVPSRPDRFCSPSCAAQVSNAKRKRTSYPICVCKGCGKEFPKTRAKEGGIYCSRICSDKAHRGPIAQPWTQKTCAYCEQPFDCAPWYSDVVHCSIKCAKRAAALTVRGENHPLWKEKVLMNCKVCGKEVVVKPSLVVRFGACSKSCAAALSLQAQQRISSIEYTLLHALNAVELHPVQQHMVGPYSIDLALPTHMLAVECDGDYWHSTPVQIGKDKRRDAYFKKHGWRVLRIAEHAIKNDVQQCVNEVVATLNQVMLP